MSRRVGLFFGGLTLATAGVAMWSIPAALVLVGAALTYLGRP